MGAAWEDSWEPVVSHGLEVDPGIHVGCDVNCLPPFLSLLSRFQVADFKVVYIRHYYQILFYFILKEVMYRVCNLFKEEQWHRVVFRLCQAVHPPLRGPGSMS